MPTSKLLLATALLLGTAAAARAQDAAAGQRIFNQCRACHTVDGGGRNGVGPSLHGIVGRRAGAVENFRYSANMRELGEDGLTWTPENLGRYLANPKEVAPRRSAYCECCSR